MLAPLVDMVNVSCVVICLIVKLKAGFWTARMLAKMSL